MQNTKKRRNRTGSILYWLFLVLWIGLLAFVTSYIWKDAARFGEYHEAAQIEPKLDAFLDEISVRMWQDGENGIRSAVSGMEHPYQTDDECVEVLRGMLQEELSCQIATAGPGTKTYNILCGQSSLGQVTLVERRFTPNEDWLLNWLIEYRSLYPWEVDPNSVRFELNMDKLYTSFEITVPERYTVLLNGHALTEDNIIETGIHYDVLEEFYDDFDGLPTKVTYHADKIFGHVDYQLLDESGNPTQIDPNRDDSQFIPPVSDELVARFTDFVPRFAYRYLEFCAGTRDMWTLWVELEPYLLKGSDLHDRCYRMIDSYLGWQHNSKFEFNGATLNSVTPLGNDIYVLDISTDSSSHMPVGRVKVHRDMLVYVQYRPNTDEVFAFSAEDYNTVENKDG